MKKVHKVATCSVTRISTPCSVQGSTSSTLIVSYVQPLWLYTGIRGMHIRMYNPLNPFITAQEMDFLIIS